MVTFDLATHNLAVTLDLSKKVIIILIMIIVMQKRLNSK